MATAASTARVTPKPNVAIAGIRVVGAVDDLYIPPSVRDFASYLEWIHSDEYPEKARTAWLDGTLWVDTTMESLFAHALVKTDVARVLGNIVNEAGSGYLFCNGATFTHAGAGVSSKPDVLFASYETVRTGKVELVEGKGGVLLSLSGTPDMVLEVVSPSSEDKDLVRLLELYFRAGIPEYWLIDARGTDPRFDIFRRGPKGYVATRKRGGFLRSAVFARGFRLDLGADPLGHPRVTLVAG